MPARPQALAGRLGHGVYLLGRGMPQYHLVAAGAGAAGENVRDVNRAGTGVMAAANFVSGAVDRCALLGPAAAGIETRGVRPEGLDEQLAAAAQVACRRADAALLRRAA
jgi:hypothetical protein